MDKYYEDQKIENIHAKKRMLQLNYSRDLFEIENSIRIYEFRFTMTGLNAEACVENRKVKIFSGGICRSQISERGFISKPEIKV